MFGTISYRLVTALAIAATVSLGAQAPVNIRLATLAPDNSPWTSALRSMGAAWEKATEQARTADGVRRHDSERVVGDCAHGRGRLQAATLMVAGLAEIDEAFNVFGMPFFFESDAELAHVQQKLTPLIQQRLQAKRYHLINWGNAGWVQLFSKAADPHARRREAGQALHDGRQPEDGAVVHRQWISRRAAAAGEIPKQLKLPTGAINAAPMPPVYAVALQIFKDAPYMLDIRLAPLVGATVMTDAPGTRSRRRIARRCSPRPRRWNSRSTTQAPALDAKSIAAMKAAGLQVITLDANAVAEFRGRGRAAGCDPARRDDSGRRRTTWPSASATRSGRRSPRNDGRLLARHGPRTSSPRSPRSASWCCR